MVVPGVAPATEEDLLRTPKDGFKYELVDGEIRVSPAGMRHEDVGVRLLRKLFEFGLPGPLGTVYGSSVGYRLPNRNVRSPDVSFVSAARLPEGVPEGFGDLSPDLAVEILSPSDSTRHVFDKVGEYLAAGSRLVWVIDPAHRTAAVYRSMTDVLTIEADGVLDGEDVLPGFHFVLSEIL